MNSDLTAIPNLQKLIDLPYYTEGPAIDSNGDIFFTTLTGKLVYRLDQNNVLSEWASCVCPNGQVILPDGDHLICDTRSSSIIRFNREGKFIKKEVEKTFDRSELYVPNDIIVSRTGGIYFTDSIRGHGKVFFMDSDGNEYTIANGLDYPNGLVLSTDERKLYVAESYRNRILVIPINASGTAATHPEVFCSLPSHPSGKDIDNLPDGMAMDRYANLWVAHYGMGALQVISAEGVLVHSFATSLPLTSNLFIRENVVTVTGGYGEPGPGAVLQFNLDHLNLAYES